MPKHQRFFHELLPIKGCKVQAHSMKIVDLSRTVKFNLNPKKVHSLDN
jgi:hypothetical protein